MSIAVWVRLGLVKVLLWRWQLRRLRIVYVCGMTKVKTVRIWSWVVISMTLAAFTGNRHVYVGRSTTGWPTRHPQPWKGYTKYTSASVFRKETSAGTEGTVPNVPWIIISDIRRPVLGHSYIALGNTAVFTSVSHVIGSGTFYRFLRPSYMWLNTRILRYDKFLRVQYVLTVDSENYMHFWYKHQPIKLYFAATAYNTTGTEAGIRFLS